MNKDSSESSIYLVLLRSEDDLANLLLNELDRGEPQRRYTSFPSTLAQCPSSLSRPDRHYGFEVYLLSECPFHW